VRRRRAAAVAGGVAVLAVIGLVAGALAPGGGDRGPAAASPSAAGARAAAADAPGAVVQGLLRVPRPTALAAERDATRWAAVRRASAVRATPGARGRVVGRMNARTAEGTTNIVVALARRSVRGALWVRVRVPNATGWVPRGALGGYGVVDTRLVVDRRRLTATLLRAGRPVFRTRVGIGRPGAPTPAGSFYVRDRLTRYASPTYGPVAFGTSATSPTLTDWPAGGFVGIHGTDRPDLIPGRVSHGCIRMRNAAILRLARLMPVGTPVTVR
jgi:L,D-transpeptidase-like protein